MSEQWLPVVGFEGLYEVSDEGRVRSLDRDVHLRHRNGKMMIRPKLGQILRPGTMKRGHKIVILGHGNPRLVHHLLLEAFVGPRPPGHEGLHGDGDAGNNHLGNLRWGTRAENIEDARRHGTLPLGERHVRARLRETDIPTIRALLRTEKATKVAERYGVSRGAIQGIQIGRNWKHVPERAA